MDGREIANQYWTKVNAFLQLADAMPPGLRETPHVLGDWSVKDVLAHLTYWDANNIWILESEAMGHPFTLDEGDVDARNAIAVASRRDMSWAELRDEATTRRNYRRLLHMRPSGLDYSGAGEHWDEHREEIEDWLRKNQSPIGANTLTPGQIADQYAERSGRVIELITNVPADRRTEGGVCGEWSIKDLLGHLAYWDSVTIASLEAELHGNTWTPDPRHVDVINSVESERRREWSWERVLDEANTNRASRIRLHLMPVATEMSGAGEHWVEHGTEIEAWVAEHTGRE